MILQTKTFSMRFLKSSHTQQPVRFYYLCVAGVKYSQLQVLRKRLINRKRYHVLILSRLPTCFPRYLKSETSAITEFSEDELSPFRTRPSIITLHID